MLGLKLNHVSKRGPWRQIDDKPLYEPKMAYIYFIDGYMRYSPLNLMCAAYICIFDLST